MDHVRPASSGVRCMVMRGGTSKGAYFVDDDLPGDVEWRDRLLIDVMGSPDARQIDGIGGAHPLTSKVAVVAPSATDVADVDYLFLQVGVDEATVGDRQNCGNLLAGVGPFAVERGLIAADDGRVEVRIRMLNSDSIAIAGFDVEEGRPVYHGTTSISGVPGTAAPITLDFEDLAGGTCGALLPSGSSVDEIDGVACTLIDNGMPVVVALADALGKSGYESCAELEADEVFIGRLEQLRLQAGPRMHLGDVAEATVPKMTLVAPPRDGGSICTRTFIPHRCHEAIGVLGAVSVATAALLPGTPASEVLGPVAGGGATGREVSVEHPSGTFEAVVGLTAAEGGPLVERAGIVRTARKLMDGVVYPREGATR